MLTLYFDWNFFSDVCGMCLHAYTQCVMLLIVMKFLLRCFP